MTPRVLLGRAVTVWLLMMLIETVHGVLRAMLLVPRVGDLPARQIGVFTGSLLILAVTYLSLGWLRLDWPRLRIVVGIVWALLTLAFEAILGRIVLGYPWSRLAADYNPAHGGLMGLGLLVMVFAPSIAYAFATRGLTTGAASRVSSRVSRSSEPGGTLRRVGH
jgi:apolipoprotein N-acyltransferase